MANEQMTITQNKARLSVIGRSWADISINSGDGNDLVQDVIEELIDLGIDLPPIDPDDWDDIDAIIGLDEDGNPILIYIDPDTGDLTEWDLTGLDIDDLDLGWELDFNFSLDDLNISVDDELNIEEERLPASIEIVTLPKKLRYPLARPIDLSGMVVTAKKSDGSTWTSAKYPNGHVPLGELIVSPNIAIYSSLDDLDLTLDRVAPYSKNTHFTATPSNGALLYINRNDEKVMAVTFISEHPGVCGTYNNSQAVANTLVFQSGEYKVYMSKEYYYTHNCFKDLDPYITEYIPLSSDVVRSLLNSITITWLRPEDKKPLSATFEIDIIPRGRGGGR